MKKNLSFLVLSIFSFFAQGQVVERLGLEGQYGYIIPHSADLLPVSKTNPIGMTLNYQRLNSSEESWQVCNCYHYLGLQLGYQNFGNPEVLGSAAILSGTFEPILWKSSKWALSIRSGIGLVYLNRVYDAETNPLNYFFSAPLSFLIFTAPTVSYSFDRHWDMNVSLNYNHISNGGQQQPNRGMNFPTLGIGLGYNFQEIFFPDYSKPQLTSDWIGYAEGGFTTRNASGGSQRKISINVAVGAIKPFTHINGIGGGLEVTKDNSLAVQNNGWEALMPAPFVAHHLIFGRFDFSQRMALYTHKPAGYNNYRFYQRYLIQFSIRPQLYLGISLKSHGHVAENIDGRIGWRF